MASHGIVAIWVLARIQQQADNVDVAMVCRQRKRQVPRLSISIWKQPASVVCAPQSRGDRQVDGSTALNQCVHRLALAMQSCGMDSGAGICSVIAKQVD